MKRKRSLIECENYIHTYVRTYAHVCDVYVIDGYNYTCFEARLTREENEIDLDAKKGQ